MVIAPATTGLQRLTVVQAASVAYYPELRSARVGPNPYPYAWPERTRRDLPVEAMLPSARNWSAAGWTTPVSGDVVSPDEVPVTLDQGFVARGAARVFEIANLARQVAGVDEP